MTRQELSELIDLHRREKALEERRERLRESVQRYAAPLSDMPHGSSWKDPMAEYAAKLDELDRQILDLVMQIENRIQQIEDFTKSLTPNQAAVVRLRYENGYSWGRIAKELNYSKGHCRNLHTDAMKRLDL